MTAVISRTLRCEGDHCTTALAAPHQSTGIRELRTLARHQGWTTHHGDRCPTHASPSTTPARSHP